MRHEAQEKRLQRDALLRAVHLREAVVIEDERRVRRDELRRVVTERSGRVGRDVALFWSNNEP
jgi:hypothetical protein